MNLTKNTWYTYTDNFIFTFLFDGTYDKEGDPKGCGFINEEFVENIEEGWSIKRYTEKASNEHVLNLLKTEAIRRGLVEGALVSFDKGNKKRILSGTYEYDPKWLDNSCALIIGNSVIFRGDTGEWDELIEEPQKQEQSQLQKILREDKYLLDNKLYIRYVCNNSVVWMTENNLVPQHKVEQLERLIL